MNLSIEPPKALINQALRFVALCCVLSVMLFGGNEKAFSIEMSDMGVLALKVNDESESNRARGIREGLSIVLQRLSGKRSVVSSEAGRTLLNEASRYLIQFSYDTVPASDRSDSFYSKQQVNQTLSEESEEVTQKILKLSFDQQVLTQKLQEAQEAVWGINRPEILFWWVNQSHGQRITLSAGEASVSNEALHFYSEKRAVPIKLPLMDLMDRSLVSHSDLWGGYVDQIAEANRRYKVTNWVQGKSYISQDRWHAEWEVHVLGGVQKFTMSAPSLDLLHRKVIDTLASVLSKEYSVISQGNQNEWFIAVKGVDQLEKLLVIKEYLARLFVVSHVELKKVQNDEVYFRLVLKEGVDKFEKLLTVDNKLIKMVGDSVSAQLSYKELGYRENVDAHNQPDIDQLGYGKVYHGAAESASGSFNKTVESKENNTSSIERLNSTQMKSIIGINYYRWAVD